MPPRHQPNPRRANGGRLYHAPRRGAASGSCPAARLTMANAARSDLRSLSRQLPKNDAR